VTTGKIRRAEMRRQLKIAQQLKVVTLTIVALLLLAAYPVYLLVRASVQDPILGALNGLDLPSWAAMNHQERAEGSRWCIGGCRMYSSSWESERVPEETDAAFRQALGQAGWRERAAGTCPRAAEGIASCWKRDEYVMDMWVRAPICELPPPRPTTGTSTPAPTPTVTCPQALVTMQVYNAISYPNLEGPNSAPPPTGSEPAPTAAPS
jgi:integrin beta 3